VEEDCDGDLLSVDVFDSIKRRWRREGIDSILFCIAVLFWCFSLILIGLW
jgi:hypothetical protein